MPGMKNTKTPRGKKTKLPPDYDVIMPGMGYTKPTKKSPPKKLKTTPAPLPGKPKNMAPAKGVKKTGKKK
jgi:hypothetical protein